MDIEGKGQRKMKKRNILHIWIPLLIAATAASACSQEISPVSTETSFVATITTETSYETEIETEATTETTEEETTTETVEETSEETTEEITEETTTPVTEPDTYEDFTYQISIVTAEGASSDKGYYVFNAPANALRYVVVISSDNVGEGGYEFIADEVKYDGSIVTITVEESPLDFVEEGSYPCCAVELSTLPDEIIVKTTDDEVLEPLYVYLKDEEISDDYKAIFYSDGGQEKIYVYELSNGEYKWLIEGSYGDFNQSDTDKSIRGFGLAKTKEELMEFVRKHSCRIFTYPGETDYHSVDAF